MTLDPMDESLKRLADEAIAAEAVRQIGHEAWLYQRSAESSHLLGVLLDLAERNEPATLLLASGNKCQGHIELVGRDVVGVRTDQGRQSLFALKHLSAVIPHPAAPEIIGDRELTTEQAEHLPRFHTVLEDLLEDPPLVAATMAGQQEPVVGSFIRLGLNVLVIRQADGSSVHIPVSALEEFAL
ncbi:MAG: hypothetical protein OSA06_01370 [Acidimicrobiales bacterium]|nr:hypothetical protein [Acidimicrobiales bacterium]